MKTAAPRQDLSFGSTSANSDTTDATEARAASSQQSKNHIMTEEKKQSVPTGCMKARILGTEKYLSRASVLLAAAPHSSTTLRKRAALTLRDLMPYTACPWKAPAAYNYKAKSEYSGEARRHACAIYLDPPRA